MPTDSLTVQTAGVATQLRFEDCVAILNQGGTPRVWSLIVSFFGDLAQSEGDTVSGVVLSRIGSMAGISPEALRVALHRLRRDGWLDSKRDGRRSFYFLTKRGREESAAASPRIYGGAVPEPGSWTILISESGSEPKDVPINNINPDGCIFVGDNVAIVPGESAGHDEALLCFSGTEISVPVWLKQHSTGPELVKAAGRLHDTLKQLEALDSGNPALSALEVATLRTLVVHSWRRVRLRQPDLPDRFFGEDWKGPDCRDLFKTLLAALPKPALTTLEAEANGGSTVRAGY